jgi:hypothetical protein
LIEGESSPGQRYEALLQVQAGVPVAEVADAFGESRHAAMTVSASPSDSGGVGRPCRSRGFKQANISQANPGRIVLALDDSGLMTGAIKLSSQPSRDKVSGL